MKPKKNHGANLEKRRAIHIQVGLIIALSFVLVSLEWGTKISTSHEGFYIPDYDIIKEVLPIVIPEEREKPKIPIALVPIPVSEELIEIDNENPIWWDPEDIGGGFGIFDWYDEPEVPLPETFNPWDVEFKAEFPGGEKAMMEWLYENISYPRECVEHGIEGRVTAKFTLSKSGKITEIKIMRGAHPLLDAEVIRILNLMPDFRPAMRKGKLVPVFMHIPVVFDLQ